MYYRQIMLFLGCTLLSSIVLLAQKPIKVACVGNSITAGYLLKDAERESYPSVLQKMLGDGYEVGNFGHSGATLLSNGHRPYVQTEEFKKALAFDADIVIVHLGLNDTDPRNWPNYAQNFQRDYLKLLDTLGINRPGKQFYIARLSPLLPAHRRYYTSSRDWFKEVNDAIASIRGVKYQLLDFSVPFTGRWHLFPDALHPNAEGARLLAEYVYRNIQGEQVQPLTLHPYWRDNMIIQRGQVSLRGQTTARGWLSYELKGQKSKRVQADEKGNFVIPLDCSRYGAFDLTILDETTWETKHIRNIQVGEVWIASGQSNMEMSLAETVGFMLANIPADPLLQYIDMKPRARTENVEWNINILDSVNAYRYYHPYRFTSAEDNTSLPSWSAVAYHFARRLRDSLNCPVAIIHNAVGGSPIESWLDPDMLQKHYPDVIMDWQNKEYAQDWVRERSKKNIAKRPQAQTHPYAPGYLHIAGWQPIRDIPHRGVIWYQGESNAHAPEKYAEYFEHLLKDYHRSQVEDSQTNVYAVQLSSINRPSWGYFRTKQAVPSEHYIPSYDLGDSLDVHPRRKALIGERLALRALERTYKSSYKSSAPSIELVKSVVRDDRVDIQVQLKNLWYGLKSTDGKPLRGIDLILSNGQVVRPTQIEEVRLSKKDAKQGRTVLLIKDLPLATYVLLNYAGEAYTRANIMGGNGMPLMPAVNIPIDSSN